MNGIEVDQRLRRSLLLLRLGVFAVMAVWTLDKFLNPAHAAAVFEHFYLIKDLSNGAAYALGTVQAIVVLGFVIGFQKRITYGHQTLGYVSPMEFEKRRYVA